MKSKESHNESLMKVHNSAAIKRCCASLEIKNLERENDRVANRWREKFI